MKYLKIITLLIFILIVCRNGSFGQSERIGVKGGFNFSNLFIDQVDDENVRTGFHVGVYSQHLFDYGTVGLQPELLYSTKGSSATYNLLGYQGVSKFNLNYIDAPLSMLFKLGEEAEIHGGGYIGYLVGASVSTDGDFGNDINRIDRDHFKSVDFGLSAGFAIHSENISIGLRYNHGLRKIADSDIANTLLGNSKNSVGQLYAVFNIE